MLSWSLVPSQQSQQDSDGDMASSVTVGLQPNSSLIQVHAADSALMSRAVNVCVATLFTDTTAYKDGGLLVHSKHPQQTSDGDTASSVTVGLQPNSSWLQSHA